MARGVVAGSLIAGVVGGVAGAAVMDFLRPAPAPPLVFETAPGPVPAPPASEPPSAGGGASVPVAHPEPLGFVPPLERGRASDVPTGGPAAPDTGSAEALAALLRRLDAIEVALSRLNAQSIGGSETPRVSDVADIRRQLARLGLGATGDLEDLSTVLDHRDPADPERVELITLLLAARPPVEGAQGFLSELVGIHLRWGRDREASGALEQWGARLGATDLTLRKARVALLEETGDREALVAALRALIEMRELAPHQRPIRRRSLAQTLLESGRFEEARFEYERSISDAEAQANFFAAHLPANAAPDTQAEIRREWIQDGRVGIARALIGEGHTDEARVILKDIVEFFAAIRWDGSASRRATMLLSELETGAPRK